MMRVSRQTVAIALLGMLCNACDSKVAVETPMNEPPPGVLKPGQVLDPNSEYAKKWPPGPSLFRWQNGMVFQVPPQYMPFWHESKVTHPPTELSKVPVVPGLGFQFFMPDFRGYTPDNYKVEFHEDKVNVVQITFEGMGQEQLGSPGSYPPNVFINLTRQPNRTIDPEKYVEQFGLRCYDKPADEDFQQCFGKNGENFIFLRRMPPPYASWVRYPLMQARYFTPKYGGMEIVWRAHMKHFASWRDIDNQVWKFIDNWMIVNPGSSTPQTK